MTNWWQPSKTSELKPIPWLAPEAIAYLEKLIQPDWKIIEHGSGGSTLWFAQRAKCVTAFESNAKWLQTVQEKAPKNANVELWDKTRLIADHQFDLLLIDGEPVHDRRQWIADAHFIVKPGGWIVLDNANRPEYAKEREGLKQHADLIRTVDSNGKAHTSYLVTEFWKVKGGKE